MMIKRTSARTMMGTRAADRTNVVRVVIIAAVTMVTTVATRAMTEMVGATNAP